LFHFNDNARKGLLMQKYYRK